LKLALGTAQFGLNYGLNNSRGNIPQDEVVEILKRSIDAGIDLLDSAYIYGNSLDIIGSFLRGSKANLKIVSKLPQFNPQDLEHKFFEMLNRIGVRKIYGLLYHDFNFFINWPKTWETMRKLKEQGVVEKIGFSLYYPGEIDKLLKKEVQFDLVQVPYSIFDQRFSKVFSLLKRKGIEIHVRSVFLQGAIFKDPDELDDFLVGIRDKLVALRRISEQFDIPLSALGINFVLLNEYVDRVIIGIDGINNLEENIGSLNYMTDVRGMHEKLLELREDNEDLILPINWPKAE